MKIGDTGGIGDIGGRDRLRLSCTISEENSVTFFI